MNLWGHFRKLNKEDEDEEEEEEEGSDWDCEGETKEMEVKEPSVAQKMDILVGWLLSSRKTSSLSSFSFGSRNEMK